MAAPLLEIEGVSAGYGAVRVLHGISLRLHPEELLLLVGPNGAGKSTLMRVLIGLHRPAEGSIFFAGERITSWTPNRRARHGLTWIPEGRGVIPELTVEENLDLARFGRDWTPARREQVLERFPVLGRSLRRAAGTLSGGEQQMLALGRALASGPRLLLVDEPSLGLAPVIVDEVMSLLRALREEGHCILLVEQRAAQVQHVASRVMLMRDGRLSDAPEKLEFTEMDFTQFVAIDASQTDMRARS